MTTTRVGPETGGAPMAYPAKRGHAGMIAPRACGAIAAAFTSLLLASPCALAQEGSGPPPPAEPAAATLTLTDAFVAAYRRNPTLAGARARARGADEGLAQARAEYLPRVAVTGQYAALREREDQLGFFGGRNLDVIREIDPSSVGVEVTQQVFTGFRRGGQQRFASAQSRAAHAELQSVEQQVLFGVASAFMDARRDTEIERIQLENLGILEQELAAARDRHDVREVTRTDVAQAEARVASGRAGLAASRADVRQSRARLGELTGLEPLALDAPPPPPQPPPSLEDALDLARRNNPTVVARRFLEKGSEAQVRVERSALLPQVNAVARVEHRENADFRGQNGREERATVQASIPLFEGGRSWSRLRQARDGVAEARAATDAADRAVMAEVVAAWTEYYAAQEVRLATAEQARAAEFALASAREELAAGLRATIDVLDAQRDNLEAQLAVARATRNLEVAAYALAAATGALDAEQLRLPVEVYDPERHRRAIQWRIVGP